LVEAVLGGGGAPLRLCTCSAPALHLLCTRSPPALSSRAAAPAPLHPPLRTLRRLLRAARAARRLAAADRARAGRPDRALLRHAARRRGAARYRGDIAEISRRYRGDIGEIARHAARRRGAASRAPGCSPAPPRPAQPGCSPVCPGYRPVSRTVSGSRLCPPRLQAARALAAGRCTQAPMPAPRRAASSSASQ